MSTISSQVGAIQDRVQDTLADMKPRDRVLFIGLVVFAALALAGGAIWWMRGSIQSLESKVADREDTLRRIQLLAAEHAAAEADFEALASRLASKANVDVSSFMEKAADKAQIREKLDSVRKSNETSDGIIQEAVYTVKLTNLNQQELANFLAEVEGSDMPLRIRAFKSRARKRKGETTLQVDMDISGYKVVEQATAEDK